MSITGLYIPKESAPDQISTVDVTEAVGVTLDAYKHLTRGELPDEDQATESLTTDFTNLTELGQKGRLFVPVPQGISFDQILQAADGMRAEGVDSTYTWSPLWTPAPLWTPGAENNSYTKEQLDAAPETTLARLALFSNKAGDDDPLLHHLGLLYDKEDASCKETTQLDAIATQKQQFEDQNPEYNLTSLNHRDIALFALMDRIRGVRPQAPEFVLNRGFMRVPELGRRTLSGGSCGSWVGHVHSRESRLMLARSNGYAVLDGGVGVSVGQNEEVRKS